MLFTSHIEVNDVPVVPRSERPRCVSVGNGSMPLCVEEVEPCGEQQLVDEMVDGLGIQYNSNVPRTSISY